jgi:Ser/Thr protein kinase RdoA (MazF antagonist)
MDRELADELSAWLAATYGLPNPDVSLLRAYTNDVHVVVSAGSRRVLKVYAPGWRRDTAIRWELDLFRHLAAHGIETIVPIPAYDGECLKIMPLRGALRQVVLFPFAAGTKPNPPFTAELYAREAISLARLHAALDSFASPHHRPGLDLEVLIWRPLRRIRAMALDSSGLTSMTITGQVITDRLAPLIERGLDWGPCHGDATFDNVHLTEDKEFIWYDFDSGGPGWRALDLQGWAALTPECDDRFRAFVEGYREVRRLAQANVEAAPYLHLAQEIWGIAVALERRMAPHGPVAMTTHLEAEAARIAARLDQLTG